MKEVILIPLGILTALIVILVTLYVRLFLIIKNRTNAALNLVKRHKIFLTDKYANFFGQNSKGMGQNRGNGILIFTDKGIFFEMWFPKKSMHIPLASIIKADKVTTFLGKTKSKPLLKIQFYNDKGMMDSAAWLVKDPDKWVFRINKVVKNV